MNASQFQKLSTDLRSLARIIPLHWGAVQNNRFDSNINMFEIDSFEQLEAAIRNLSPELQNYFRRRWYLWKCAQCDEWLIFTTINKALAFAIVSRIVCLSFITLSFNLKESLYFVALGVLKKKFIKFFPKISLKSISASATAVKPVSFSFSKENAVKYHSQ